MNEMVKITICAAMGVCCLLASFAVDGTMHNLMEDDARIDLVAQINGARKFLLFSAGAFALIMFL